MTKTNILAIACGAVVGAFILPLGFVMAHRAVTCACPTDAQLANFAATGAMVSFVAAGISMWRRQGAGHQLLAHTHSNA